MAQGGRRLAPTVTAEQASQQPGNSLLQHMNFRGHEAEAVNQEQPEHILGKTFEFYFQILSSSYSHTKNDFKI